MLAAGDERGVEVGEALDALGSRSYGPLLMLPALIAVMPVVGALPGVSWGMAGLILLIGLQFLIARRKLWAPGPLRRMELGRRILVGGAGVMRPLLRVLDAFARPRLQPLVQGPFARLAAVSIIVLALAMYVLSIVPGGVVPPALIVLVFAAALTTQDGVLVLIGHALTGGCVYFAARVAGWV